MKTTFILALSLAYISSQAQTKIIAHKSHSGSNNEFSMAFENDLFDIDDDNLGMAPERYEIKKKQMHPQLDSVIFMSQEKTLVVTSTYCTSENIYNRAETKKEIWSPGKEIAINHPLFSKNHSLDSIKTVLKTQYGFENSIDDVVFIGYDNKAPQKPVANQILKEDKNDKPKKHRNFADNSVIVVLGITLGVFFSGLFMLNKQN